MLLWGGGDTDRETGELISLLSFLESRLKMAKATKRRHIIEALQLKIPFVAGVMWQQKYLHTSLVSVWLYLNSDFIA
jgi:hypothetical protein